MRNKHSATSSCEHNNWDEHFDKCEDCGVTLEALGLARDEDGGIITAPIEGVRL